MKNKYLKTDNTVNIRERFEKKTIGNAELMFIVHAAIL